MKRSLTIHVVVDSSVNIILYTPNYIMYLQKRRKQQKKKQNDHII